VSARRFLGRLERIESLLKKAMARATAALAAAGAPLPMGGDVTGTTAASVLSRIAALAGGGNRLVGVDNNGNIIVGTEGDPVQVVVMHAQVPNDNVPFLLGALNLSAQRTFFIIQTWLCRNNVGGLTTIQHRLTIKGDPALIVVQADIPFNAVGNMALTTQTNAVAGSLLNVSVQVPLLAVSAYDVTVYNEIYAGLGTPP
jgi:hypothetical protein